MVPLKNWRPFHIMNDDLLKLFAGDGFENDARKIPLTEKMRLMNSLSNWKRFHNAIQTISIQSKIFLFRRAIGQQWFSRRSDDRDLLSRLHFHFWLSVSFLILLIIRPERAFVKFCVGKERLLP